MRSFLQAGLRFIAAIVFVLLCYVLSFGPAGAWVARTMEDKQPTVLDVAIYDSHLSTYYQFYAPLIHLRVWLGWSVSRCLERAFVWYDELFYKPVKLAGGGRVFTTVGFVGGKATSDGFVDGNVPHTGESMANYTLRLAGPGFPAPRPGTAVYNLPRSHRLLFVLAPNEDELLVAVAYDAGIEEYSPTFFADLRGQ